MNLKELKDQIIAAYEWDREFGDEVRNVETYEELANVIKDRENFYPINADWIRECERPDLFFTGRENTGLFNSGDRNSGYRNSGDRNSGNRNSGDLNSGNLNSGDRNSGNRNSGDRNSGDRNSGERNSGDRNSGDRNSGDRNSGDRNSGYRNSGYRNSGDRNSGDLNSGDLNSGNLNSGNLNSGNLNSGNRNSGDLNSGYRNSGVFCNRKRNDKIFFFNKESSFTWEDWYRHKVYCIVQDSFVLTDWIDWDDMSDEEKENNPDAYVNYGYLRVYTYKEAWANLWSELTDDQKELFKTLPNFDADIFEDITGIEI